MSPYRSAAVVAVVLLAAPLVAQLRKPCIGSVVDAEGKGVAGADVTLVWTPGMGAPGELDIIHVVSDGRGIFKAALVLGHAYSAWAIGPMAADGSRFVSEVTDRAAPGVVVELVAWRRWQPRELHVAGLQAWTRDQAPRLKLFPDARSGLGVDLPALRNGAVALPPCPWTDAAIAVCDAAGMPLSVKALARIDASGAVEFEPPVELDVTVADATGAPVADARVELMLSTHGTGGDAVVRRHYFCFWRPAGTTGADGSVHLQLPGEKGSGGWLRAGRKETAWCYAPTSKEVRDGKKLSLTLDALPEVSVHVLGLGPGDLVEAQALLMPSFKLPGSRYSLALGMPARVERNDLAFDQVPTTGSESSILLRLLPRGEGTPRYVLTSPVRGWPPRFSDINLLKLRRLQLSAVDAGGNPIPGAEVMAFRPSEEPMHGAMAANHFVLDHAGRAELACDEDEWAIYVSTGKQHALHFVDAGAGGGSVRLQLEAMPVLRCHVVDVEGSAVRWARLEAAGGGGMGGVLRGARGWAKEAIASLTAMSSAGAARSDGTGMLVMPVQDWRPMTMRVRVRAGDLVSEPFVLAADDQVREVVVR